MPTSNTAPLVRELAEAIPSRPFAIRLWDGTDLPPTEGGGEAPTLDFRSPAAVAHVLRAPGQLGLGRAYVSGALVVDDLDSVLRLADSWRPPPLDRVRRARIALAGLRACGPMRPPRIPAAELRPRGRLHSRSRDARAVQHHYDVPSEFFALFLDRSLTYSCGIFSRGAETLEDAQTTKLDLVCAKLRLEPGMRVLDVGCGWGSFALRAATEHGASVVGITLSEPQAEVARRRVREAGLDQRVEIRVTDYRELAGERFDAVASIGMVEHVGEQRIDEYARRLAALLEPGGRLLNHGIARVPADLPPAGPFSERYVFPDGDPLNLSRVQLALERAGLLTEHVEGFQADYAETLRHWIRRLDDNLDEAVRLGGAERTRVWRLYLRAARNGFESGLNSVYQVRCRPARPAPEAGPGSSGRAENAGGREPEHAAAGRRTSEPVA